MVDIFELLANTARYTRVSPKILRQNPTAGIAYLRGERAMPACYFVFSPLRNEMTLPIGTYQMRRTCARVTETYHFIDYLPRIGFRYIGGNLLFHWLLAMGQEKNKRVLR